MLNPVFFAGMVWTAIVFWRRGRHHPLLVYLFSMGAPLFLACLLYAFHSRVMPNWIAPAVLPLFCLMVIYGDTQWRMGKARVKGWLAAGLGLGLPLVILGHNTDGLAKLIGRPLPVKLDVLYRVRQWRQIAAVVGQARQELLAEGKPVFIIAGHCGLAGNFRFISRKPKRASRTSRWCIAWPAGGRTINSTFGPAIAGARARMPFTSASWTAISLCPNRPGAVGKEFESVTSLGVRNVLYQDRCLLPPCKSLNAGGSVNCPTLRNPLILILPCSAQHNYSPGRQSSEFLWNRLMIWRRR